MLIDVKKGYWYRFKLVLDDKPVEDHDNTVFYADSFTILTARKAMVNEILYNITIIAQAALNRGLDFLPVKRFEIEYNPYYFLEDENGTRFPVSRESRTLGCYAHGLSYEEKNMPADEKPGFEKFGFKNFDISSEDRELSEAEVSDLLKSIVELTKEAFDEEFKRVKDYRDNYAKQHITNEIQYLLKNTDITKEELLAVVKEFVMKSKTERNLEAMDAIYKEEGLEKEKSFGKPVKRYLVSFFEIATRLFLIYGIYYFMCKVEPGDVSVTIATGAIASAAILLNVKDRKIDKLEKELKDHSYNIEKE